MKKLFLLFCFALVLGCSKEDSCDCRHSVLLNQLVPGDWTEEFILTIIDRVSDKQKEALEFECEKKCD